MEFDHLIAKYKPRGYELEQKHLAKHYGLTTNIRKITIPPLKSRHALFVFLHEVGHVRYKHLHIKDKRPSWRHEYEADQYAIREMKKLRIAIPRRTLADAREVLRGYLENAAKRKATRCTDKKVLRYAYGENKWRAKYEQWK